MSIAKRNYLLPLECQLHSGDHLSQTEFHSLYVQMPEKFKAELVGGVVLSYLWLRHWETCTGNIMPKRFCYLGSTPLARPA